MSAASGPPASRLDPARLRRELAAAGLRYRLRAHSQVGSTQDLALTAAAAKAPEGLVVISDLQLAGRGRSGRAWTAPAGRSLMFSLLWRPLRLAQDWGTLPLMVGLAVAEGIEAAGGPEISVKWPNDCLVHDRKVAGVLVESAASPQIRAAAVVVGVGCNVSWSGLPAASRPGQWATALDLEGGPVEVTALAFQVLLQLERRYRQWCARGFAPMRAEWQRRSVWVGQEVAVSLPDRVLVGVLRGVSAAGELVLEVGGSEIMVAAGDLAQVDQGSIRPLRSLDDPGQGI